MSNKLRAFLTGVGSLVDLDGRATRQRLQETAQAQHPFFDRCPHGTQFLDECDICPGGWQPQSERPEGP